MRFISVRWLCALMAALGAIAAGGCAPLQQTKSSRTLLKPIDLDSNSLQLEVISIRFPFGDEQMNGPLWNEIDEQQIPLSTRSRLAENGIRAGVVGGEMPPSLARLIGAAEQQPTSVAQAAERLEQTPPASRQQMQLHSGWRGEIIASNVYPELPLLMRENGQPCGHTYPSAQGVLATKAEAMGDRRVVLHLTPELQYGQTRQQFVIEDGRLLPQQGKPKRMFDQLAFDATLAQGDMLVLTSLPQHSGTLGHYLFTESPNYASPDDGQLQQKLLIVRLSQSRKSDLFTPPAVSEPEPGPLVAKTAALK
ncbi:MAG TPA: hypothetical protein VGJ15_03325 [Pirellulales bacterium]